MLNFIWWKTICWNVQLPHCSQQSCYISVFECGGKLNLNLTATNQIHLANPCLEVEKDQHGFLSFVCGKVSLWLPIHWVLHYYCLGEHITELVTVHFHNPMSIWLHSVAASPPVTEERDGSLKQSTETHWVWQMLATAGSFSQSNFSWEKKSEDTKTFTQHSECWLNTNANHRHPIS